MEETKETRHEYLAVLKHALDVTTIEAFQFTSSVIRDLMTSLYPSDEFKDKMKAIHLRNAMHEKVQELEAMALQSPELMHLPIEAHELIDVSKVGEKERI